MTEERDYFQEWVSEVGVRLLYHKGLSKTKHIGERFNNWCDKLFFFGKTPEQAADIIQRAYKLYINR
jgi:dihydropteroate synthase